MRHAVHDPGSRFEVTGNLEGNDAAESAHLAPGYLVLWMSRQTGIVHRAHPRVGRQKLGKRLSIGVLPRDSKREGLEATDKEVGDERINDRSGHRLQSPDPIHQFSGPKNGAR